MPLFRRHGTHGPDAPRAAGSPGAIGTSDGPARLEARVSGIVQGVGFRYWTLAEAEKRGLVGSAGNLPDGTVQVVAEGPRAGVEGLLAWLRSGETPGRVDRVDAGFAPATGEFSRFSLF
ncbi:acylphosphatase [Sinomonas cyclohexanicum]|uniref:acylphosphatase n=1 Tax=Sinomonas cyclohexanicum TaxID=322009 RepID=A0ABM7PRG5_SINCY|nr:acylphosphatase [Corynebacterium cyclohexanicum]